jgi:S-adenosylmethionine:tRNA ribosyltransferase-isomerase
MDSEELKLLKQPDIVNDAKVKEKRICTVGTTSMRAVESSVSSHGTLNPFDGWTKQICFPPHEFTIPTCDYKLSYAKIYF